jgi:DNA polymerase
MIVGEAPGKNEVEQGRPFVGKSGQYLESVLNALGVRREEVFITNVVKEWPRDSEGKTRTPYDEEVAQWDPILRGEILHVAPVAILALGRTATTALTFLAGEKIPFGSKIGNVYTAWHPAYLLRRGKAPEAAEEWLEQIRPWAEALGKFEYPS